MSLLGQNMRLLMSLGAMLAIMPYGMFGASTVLNFDTVIVSPGCTDASAYLASFGITFVPATPGALSFICNVVGSAINANSGTNVFVGGPPVTNTNVSYDLNFSTPLAQLGFTRTGVNPATSTPPWSIYAYNASNTVLSSVGEAYMYPGPASPQIFTLTGPGITRVHVDALNSIRASFNHPPIDDMILTQEESSAPTDLKATQIGNTGTQIRLTWDYGGNPIDIDGFIIERSNAPAGTWDQVATRSPDTPFLVDASFSNPYGTYSYRVRAYMGTAESSNATASCFQLHKQILGGGVETWASFTPDPSSNLGTVARNYGYDHFNWIQVINHDPESYSSPPPGTCPGPNCPWMYNWNGTHVGKPVLAPNLDPPPGGYSVYGSGPFWADDLVYYWNEVAATTQWRDYGIWENGDPVMSPTAVFHDRSDWPTIPDNSSQYAGFYTTLVGVNTPVGGTPEKYTPLASFEWNTQYNGRWGLAELVPTPINVAVEPIKGRGGVFNVVGVDVNDLPLNIRQLLIQSGAQGVSSAPKIDKDAPTTAAFLSGPLGANGWYTGPVTVTLIATDIDGPSDIAATTYSVDAGSVTTYTSPFTVSGVGTHTIQFSSVDLATNVERPLPSQLFTITLTTPTTTFIGAPTAAAYGSSFLVSATTNANTIASIVAGGACSIVGSTVTMITGTGTCSLTATWAADNNYNASTSTQFTSASKIAQTMMITPISNPTALLSYTLSSTSSSNIAPIFVSTTPSVCTVSGSIVTLTATGNCAVTASFPTTSNYLAGSARYMFTVAAPFTITPTPSAETAFRGRIAAFVLNIHSFGAFKGNVVLSCSGGPAGTVCQNFPMTVRVMPTGLAISGLLIPLKAQPGVYPITFTGVSGSLAGTATATFTVK